MPRIIADGHEDLIYPRESAQSAQIRVLTCNEGTRICADAADRHG